ncbi:MAG: response regulator [Limisphaerales bacterium]
MPSFGNLFFHRRVLVFFVAAATWQLDILVAEDTPSDIRLLEKALERCGDVRSLKIVKDGQELVDYLQGRPPFNQPDRQLPNVILMDLKMPRMDGFAVLAWLRKNPECSVIPVIVMSSSGLDSDVLEAYRLGANAFFEKPADFNELQEILRSILIFWSHAKRPPLTRLCS